MAVTIEEQIRNLEKLVDRLLDDKAIQQRVTTVAALETFAEYKDRIFSEGKDSNEAKIGNYDTKPFYAGASQLKGLPKSKFKIRGKNGKAKFKNGKLKKTSYQSGGYQEFRKTAGRQNRFVDLNLTGASARSIQLGTKGGGVVFGFTDDSRRLILEGNEKRFRKDIFSLSIEEQKTFRNAAVREIKAIINEAL